MIIGKYIDLQTCAVVKNALVLKAIGAVQIFTFAKNDFVGTIDNWGAVKKAMGKPSLVAKTIALGKSGTLNQEKKQAKREEFHSCICID